MGRPASPRRTKKALQTNLEAQHEAVISVDQWETVAGDRTRWRAGIKQGVELFEAKRLAAMDEKRVTRKNRLQQQQAGAGGGDHSFVCGVCQRDCHSRIGLVSHSRTHRSELPTSSSSATRDSDDDDDRVMDVHLNVEDSNGDIFTYSWLI